MVPMKKADMSDGSTEEDGSVRPFDHYSGRCRRDASWRRMNITDDGAARRIPLTEWKAF